MRIVTKKRLVWAVVGMSAVLGALWVVGERYVLEARSYYDIVNGDIVSVQETVLSKHKIYTKSHYSNMVEKYGLNGPPDLHQISVRTRTWSGFRSWQLEKRVNYHALEFLAQYDESDLIERPVDAIADLRRKARDGVLEIWDIDPYVMSR